MSSSIRRNIKKVGRSKRNITQILNNSKIPTNSMALEIIDPSKELSEIRNQLTYSKRIGFLFGAGTSKAMGVPDIAELTKIISDSLKEGPAKHFEQIMNELDETSKHIEGILNLVRLIRQITSDSKEKSYMEITGFEAKTLDTTICDEIYKIISTKEEKIDYSITKKFISWLNYIKKDYPKEIFTTNYDLLIEKAAESLRIPFYDGFVGSIEPFFASETVNKTSISQNLPVNWIRLWKIHGSLGWFWKTDSTSKTDRVVRLSSGSKEIYPDSELVIYPSKDKYESSRKQPYASYFDRLKEFLTEGEGIFLITGYSFSDEHVNEVLFSCLKHNTRMHAIAFFYSDDPLSKIVEQDKNLPNLTLIGPTKASISGTYGEWKLNIESDLLSPFWDSINSKLTLGDYNQLVKFLIRSTGINEETLTS